MNVTIWGCRGSISRSHPSLQRYGGNTPCVEVVVRGNAGSGQGNQGEGEETRIVLDMGNGAYELGQKLVKLGPLKDQNILLTHCHWDHIQGFPFFAPLFIPGSEWSVHAPGGFTTSLKEKLASQMSYEFFPLSLDMLQSKIDYHDLTEGELTLGNVQVFSQFLNHPVLTLGYRLEAPDGTSMAYITDHEPFNRAFAVDGYTREHAVNPNDGSTVAPENGDDRHADFLKDVDLLIHDSQYTSEEYKAKAGWGHGTIEYVVDIAMAAGVKKLALFHHDPQRTDDQVDELVKLAQSRAEKANSTLEVIAAADRAEIQLEPKEGEAKIDTNPKRDSALTTPDERGPQYVFVDYSDETIFSGCEKDGMYKITYANESAWDKIFDSTTSEIPTMYVLSCDAKHEDCKNAVELSRKLRTEFGPGVPIFLIAKDDDDMLKNKEAAEEAGVGVTGWIVEPFTPHYIRTRVRMAISRSPCRWVPARIPKNEAQRLDALRSLNLSKEQEERFDLILDLARTALGTDVAALNIVEESVLWTKAFSCPVPTAQPLAIPRNESLCSHTILEKDPLIVNDLKADSRFADNPQTVSGIRFYAGAAISIPSAETGQSYNVGTLCVIQKKPRTFNEHETELLRQFTNLLQREMLLAISADC